MPTQRKSPTLLRKSPRKGKNKPDYYGGGQGNEDDSGDRGGYLIAGRKKMSKPAAKKTRKVGCKKSRRVSQAPTTSQARPRVVVTLKFQTSILQSKCFLI